MRVLIADDQPSVRSALKLVLEQNGITVVHDVTDSRELLDCLTTKQVDLVLLDWELPGRPSKKVIPVLHSQLPGLVVIVLDSRPQTRTEALAAGADGFACKGDPPEYLLEAISSCWPGNKQI